MRLFLYEWITGGGLVEESNLPKSLLAEGSAMVSAIAADFASIDGCQVTALRDLRLMDRPLAGCRLVEVHSRSQQRDEFARLASEADWALIIAPEFDGILMQTVRRVRELGVAALNAPANFLAAASNKQVTAELLASAGVPVPHAVLLDADQEKLPVHFPYPGVLKPLDGAGSQHTLLVDGPLDEPPAYPWPRRLERYCPGRAASVAALCGPHGIHALPPCWQRLSGDGRFTYLGGRLISDPPQSERALRLALRALGALPPAHGYVGVDLVLGADPEGNQDFVIEVNPRLTTSYVGLRAALAENLADSMIRVAQGAAATFTLANPKVEFTSCGKVSL